MNEYAEYVGAPSGSALLAEPWVYLSSNGDGRPSRPPANLPSDEQITDYVAELWASRKALAYLAARGLNKRTIRRERLGFRPGRNAIVIPVFACDRRLLDVRYRFLAPGSKPKITKERGHPARLYPGPPGRSANSVIVCSGEFDALVTTQNTHIETVTSTTGAGHWNDRWNKWFTNKRAAVIFDADEYAAAEKVAAALPCEAWPVQLELPGKEDLTDFWLHGGTEAELIELIQQAKETA